jgi:hypothetical protein
MQLQDSDTPSSAHAHIRKHKEAQSQLNNMLGVSHETIHDIRQFKKTEVFMPKRICIHKQRAISILYRI